jgi:hypothetical protein
MALINAPKKYVLTLIAISPQDKLNTEQRKTGEHFANDNCIY